MSYQYPLPAGVSNTNAAYFYAGNNVYNLGTFIKPVNAQSLITIDYTKITPAWVVNSFNFLVDVGGNPQLVVSNTAISTTGNVLTFLLSGGIAGQQYNLTINSVQLSQQSRSDILTINIPSDDGCGCPPGGALTSPGPNQLAGATITYNDVPRFFVSGLSPSGPNVMDWWYNPTNGSLQEYVETSVNPPAYSWHIFNAPSITSDVPVDNKLYARSNQTWVLEPIQYDAYADGKFYGRINNAWAPVATATTLWGTFNASTGVITWNTQSGQSGNSLPPPSTVNQASYLICSVAGSTPPFGAPAGSYVANDWLLSDGTQWVHIGSAGAMYASQVVVNPAVENHTDVQGALQAVDTLVQKSGVIISDTAPLSPNAGNLWWDSIGGQLYIYYIDVNSSQWVITSDVMSSINLDMGVF
jgi:hypothetical protein